MDEVFATPAVFDPSQSVENPSNGTTNNLIIVFEGQNGKDVTCKFTYADPDVEVASVKALANKVVAYNTLFENPPTRTKSAKIVTTTESYFNLDA